MQVTYQNDTDDGFQTVTAILVTGDAVVANNGTLVIPFGPGVTQTTPWNIANGELVYVGPSTTFPVAASGAGTIGISTGSGGYTLTNRTGAAWGPGTYIAFTAKYRVGLDAANARITALEARVTALEA